MEEEDGTDGSNVGDVEERVGCSCEGVKNEVDGGDEYERGAMMMSVWRREVKREGGERVSDGSDVGRVDIGKREEKGRT